MEAILHIGTGKTGSSSIQSYMSMNRQKLMDQGIYYPASLGQTNQWRLPAMVMKENKPGNFFRQRGLQDPVSRRAAKAEWWVEFQREIERAEIYERCLISAEHLASLDADEVAHLGERLSSLFSGVRVLAYLRDPVDYAVSMYDTALKVGSTAKGPAPPVVGGPTDYEALLRIWMNVFGLDRLTVRLFDREELVGGDILRDFTQTIGIRAEEFVAGKVRNPSLGVLGQQLLLRINQRLPVYKDGGPIPRRGEFAVLFENYLCDDNKLSPEPELVEAYRETFAASNEWVRQNFFPQRSTLFPAKQYRSSPTVPLDNSTLDNLAELIVAIWQRSHAAGRPSPRKKQGENRSR